MLSGDGFPEAGTFPEKVLRSKPPGTKVKRTAGQAAVRPAGQPVNQSTGQPDNQSTSPAHRGGEEGSLFTQELATSPRQCKSREARVHLQPEQRGTLTRSTRWPRPPSTHK